MGYMGVSGSNLKNLGPTGEEEDLWKRAVYYSHLSRQTNNPMGAHQIYGEAKRSERLGLPYQVTTPKGSKTYGQATYKKKSGPWSAALAADKNLAQQYQRRRGFLNKRQGTGGRISPRHTTYMEVRPSDTELSITPGSKRDKWALTPSGGSGIRRTLQGNPRKFTGRAYEMHLQNMQNMVTPWRGGVPRRQKRHEPEWAEFDARRQAFAQMGRQATIKKNLKWLQKYNPGYIPEYMESLKEQGLIA